uniref:Peptidase C1A papain C-terminal domain-containing protein n=1 Tax=viral metagenome TaxID=1070528 RepID=A0A6C0CLL1_9ZZZZ
MIQNSTEATFFNITPSPRDDRDFNIDVIFEDSYRYPHLLDWSKYLKEVQNQGVQGSSLAHAATSILEWKERKLNKRELHFSAQFLYNNRNDNKDTLVCGRDMMKLLLSKGCCLQSKCPYGKKYTKTTEAMIKNAEKYKIKRYARVNTMSGLKCALSVFGPCLITFPVYNHTSSMWKQHTEEQKLGGHAMAVVGYSLNGFILRNSWGKHWENNGLCMYPYEDWGLHFEVWCVGDVESFETWKDYNESNLKKFARKYLLPRENPIKTLVKPFKESMLTLFLDDPKELYRYKQTLDEEEVSNNSSQSGNDMAVNMEPGEDNVSYENTFRNSTQSVNNESNTMSKRLSGYGSTIKNSFSYGGNNEDDE